MSMPDGFAQLSRELHTNPLFACLYATFSPRGPWARGSMARLLVRKLPLRSVGFCFSRFVVGEWLSFTACFFSEQDSAESHLLSLTRIENSQVRSQAWDYGAIFGW